MYDPPPFAASSSHSFMSSESLPLYTPPGASPSYAAEPHDGEQRLELVARVQPAVAAGTYTKKSRSMTVIISEQEVDATIPTFARNSVIKGEVQIDEEEVLAVSVKLEGRQSLGIAEGGGTSRVLFTENHELWRKQGADSSCPSLLSFYLPFPLKFEDKQGSHPVPPSYGVEYPGVPGLYATNAYSLIFTVTKARIASWKKQKSLTVPLNYAPRSRPYMPILPSIQPFLSTVKTLPEEWYQVMSTMPSRTNTIKPVDLHLFIPSVQIYALSDSIPFHLQLRGPAESLRAFLGLHQPTPPTPSSRSATRRSPTEPSPLASTTWDAVRSPINFLSASDLKSRLLGKTVAKPSVRVFLLRQITAKVHGQKAWRNVVIGEGKMSRMERPPSWSPSANSGRESDESELDWEGEVRCNDDVGVASFIAGDLAVKDFIVIHLTPHNPETSPLCEHQHAHPIRLVTDPYRESFEHPSDA